MSANAADADLCTTATRTLCKYFPTTAARILKEALDKRLCVIS